MTRATKETEHLEEIPNHERAGAVKRQIYWRLLDTEEGEAITIRSLCGQMDVSRDLFDRHQHSVRQYLIENTHGQVVFSVRTGEDKQSRLVRLRPEERLDFSGRDIRKGRRAARRGATVATSVAPEDVSDERRGEIMVNVLRGKAMEIMAGAPDRQLLNYARQAPSPTALLDTLRGEMNEGV